jgi:hypothetical protein
MLKSNMLLASWLPATISAACTRDVLKWTTDQFFVGAFSNAKNSQSIPFTKLAPDVKITQNNQILASINDSIFGNATNFYKPFRIQSIDTESCDIATLLLLSERVGTKGDSNTTPAIVSVRLRVPGDNDLVTEVEILNALEGSHALFTPAAVVEQAKDWWAADEAGAAKDYKQLVYIADSYPAGIQSGNSSSVLAAKDCPRIENGVKTTDSCAGSMEMFIWPVTDRRWVADKQKGVVMGSFFFHYRDGKGLMNKQGIRSSNGTTGLWLHEYFKIKDGNIVDVWAAMQTLDWRYKDVWGSKN